MGKNLKDIVDEGFTQLAVLADKRVEILARAERIGKAASGSQGADAELKMKAAELRFLSEMNPRVEQLLHELRQTLEQVADDNISFHDSLRGNLKLHVSGIIAELHQTKSTVLDGASERLDILLLELEKQFQSDKSILGFETARSLSELNGVSQGNQAALRQAQTEIAAKVSLSEHEISAQLGNAFNQIVQDAEKKRHEVADFLESLYRRQVEKLESGTAELDLRISPLIREQCDKMRDSCIASEKALNQIRDTTLSLAIAELKAVSKDPLADLEHRNDSSRQELSEKLSELRELGTSLLKQEHESLLERHGGIASSADELYAVLTKFEAGAAGAGRSRVDDAFSEVSVELSGLADDLIGKLRNMLKAQSEGLARLSSSTEKGFSSLFVDFRTQLKELVMEQDELCAQKEEDVFLQLQKMEEQISETYSLLRAAGYPAKKDANGSGGGLKE